MTDKIDLLIEFVLKAWGSEIAGIDNREELRQAQHYAREIMEERRKEKVNGSH